MDKVLAKLLIKLIELMNRLLYQNIFLRTQKKRAKVELNYQSSNQLMKVLKNQHQHKKEQEIKGMKVLEENQINNHNPNLDKRDKPDLTLFLNNLGKEVKVRPLLKLLNILV